MAITNDKMRLLARVGEVFTPSSPVDRYAIFAGRVDQILEIITATRSRGQHVVLYGERGVGKTSLANVLTEVFDTIDQKSWKYVRINCNTDDDFGDVWNNIFTELNIDEGDRPAIYSPESVRRMLEGFPSSIIVIDELDRLENDEALTLLADTVKTLSDHSTRTTLVFVGVADSVEQLIGDHLSIERALVQIPMPRMQEKELEDIIEKGRVELGMEISDSALTRIARLSEGLPHFTHLMALEAFKRAISDDRNNVTDDDVDAAIGAAVEKAQQSIKSAYQRATRSVRKENLFGRVLLACALAPKDEMGFFTTGDVQAPMARIMGKRYEIAAFARHISEFTTVEKGPVLITTGPKRKQFYRFQNPMLAPFVILTALAAGHITESDLVGQAIIAGNPNAPQPLF